MQKLNFQDRVFFRLKALQRPFHIGGLMLLTLPKNVPADFTSQRAETLACLPETCPAALIYF